MATAVGSSAAQIQKTPFVRELASSDRKTRDKALESLTLFLRARRDLSLLELLKVWKGLFYCFYHSDRPLTQQALARALSYSLVPSLPRESRLRFLRAFWITIGQEFHALDRLRLDKYLFLIRCYVGVAFEVFLKGKLNNKSEQPLEETQQEDKNNAEDDGNKKRKRKEDAKIAKNGKRRKHEEEKQHQDEGEKNADDEKWTELESYISLLEEGPLCPINFDHNEKKSTSEDSIPMPHGPDGLRYHVTDIWLDELEKVITQYDANKKRSEGKQDGEEREGEKLKDYLDVPMELLLRPFEKLKAESPTKSVRLKAASEVLEDPRLVEWGFREKQVEDEDEEDEWNGLDD